MFQQLVICGNCGKDPDVRLSNANVPIAKFSIAVSEKWKDRNGVPQERTVWFRCVAFNGIAEVVGKYLKAGKRALINGRIQVEEWTDQQGQKHSSWSVVVDQLKLIDRSDREAPPRVQDYGQGYEGDKNVPF